MTFGTIQESAVLKEILPGWSFVTFLSGIRNVCENMP